METSSIKSTFGMFITKLIVIMLYTCTFFLHANTFRYVRVLLIAILLKGDLFHVKYVYGQMKTGVGSNNSVIR